MILKFGGNCFKDKSNINKVIKRIKQNLKKEKLIVICSAIGRNDCPYSSDYLLSKTKNLDDYEKASLLAIGEIYSCLNLVSLLKDKDINSCYASIYDIELRCSDSYLDAKIKNVNKDKINALFELYDVIVIPGFQAINDNNEICLLSRGGSDYSAVALASLLDEKDVYLYKDVEGVLSSINDEIINKISINELSYNQAITYFNFSGELVQIKALEQAMNKSIKVHVISLVSDFQTIISNQENKWCIYGVYLSKNAIYLFGKVDDYYYEIIKDFLRPIKNKKIIIHPSFYEIIINESLLKSTMIQLHKYFIEN